MENFRETYLPILVWLFVTCLMGFFILMCSWAKKQKGVAMALGIFAQMFLPDPKVQQTIQFVVESKQQQAQKSLSSSADEADEERQID